MFISSHVPGTIRNVLTHIFLQSSQYWEMKADPSSGNKEPAIQKESTICYGCPARKSQPRADPGPGLSLRARARHAVLSHWLGCIHQALPHPPHSTKFITWRKPIPFVFCGTYLASAFTEDRQNICFTMLSPNWEFTFPSNFGLLRTKMGRATTGVTGMGQGHSEGEGNRSPLSPICSTHSASHWNPSSSTIRSESGTHTYVNSLGSGKAIPWVSGNGPSPCKPKAVGLRVRKGSAGDHSAVGDWDEIQTWSWL